MIQDIRYAWRSLLRTPGFTTAALLTLALGIGATTAIFSLVNATLLKPVPYPGPDRIAVLTGRYGTSTVPQSSQSGLTFTLARDRIRAIEAIAAQSSSTSWNLSTTDSAIGVRGLRVSTDYLKVHGVSPLVGREFTSAEDTLGGPDSALVSESLSTRLFASPTDALGRSITLGGRPYTIVGVLPSDFVSIPSADVLTPLRTTERDMGVNYRVIGRLRADVTPEAAQADLDTMRADLFRTIPNLVDSRVQRFSWTGYREVLGRGVRQPVLMLLGAVAFLLLIACANVANLSVARAVARHREIATRASLGASRGRLIRHVLTESLVLAIAGSLLGLLVASGSMQILLSYISEDTARDLLAGGAVDLDWRVLLVTTAVTFGAGIFFGLAPALALARLDPRSVLGARTTSGPGTALLRRTLTIAEVALAVVLLVGAGLLMRTFVNLTSVDPGFTPEGIVIGRMSLQGTNAENAAARARLLEQGMARIRALPGVTAVAVSNNVPVESGLNLALMPPAGALIDRQRSVDWRYVSPDYFSLFQIETRAGTTFTDEHASGRRLVAVVNEAFARTYFGRVNVIGQTISFVPAMNDGPREIIGVVADVKARSNAGFVRNLPLGALGVDSSPAVYVPAAQAPDAAIQIANRFFDMKWIVRGSGPAVEPGIREAIRAIDPTLAFVRFEAMTSVIRRDLDMQRLLTILLGAFATSAMLLAAVGLYGVIAYSAARRRREVGVRIALGATAASVVNAFVREGIALTVVGLALGVAGAAMVTRVLSSLLFGVTPLDVTSFAVAGLALMAVALLAALIPAASAARTNPLDALRGE
jgi:putative ABC transport system permease protein